MTMPSADIANETLDTGEIFSRLREGLVLVTGNARLARVLTARYGDWRMEMGDRQWPSPAVYPWSGWLDRLWVSAGLAGAESCSGAVPGEQQLVQLWEQVLEADSGSRLLLRPESLAGPARQARMLVREWRLDLSDPAWRGEETENHVAFHRWNRAFEALCRRQGWIPPEDRLEGLAHAVSLSSFPLPGSLGLIGFDEFTPAQASLLAAVAQRGCRVGRLSLTPRRGRSVIWAARDSRSELDGMARWVRHHHEADPGSRIGVVVHDLPVRREEIERALAKILTPDRLPPRAADKPWNTSLGRPLAQVPVIESAFSLLKLLRPRVDIQDIGRVLRSPWFRGGVSERDGRSRLEKCLRDRYPRKLQLREVRYRASEIRRFDHQHRELPPESQTPQPWNCPLLSRVLDALIRFGKASSRSRGPSEWAEALDGLLREAGWPRHPGAERPENTEYALACLDWQDALRELASLNATAGGMDAAQAIGQLEQICRRRVFQPGSTPSNIQVLGHYEVTGLRFDHLWVLGLHGENWPPPARPNPFLPAALQRGADLPHASPQRELEVAKTVTRRLLATANETVFSYPGTLEGEPLLPSPLLEGLETVGEGELPLWPDRDGSDAIAHAGGLRRDALTGPGPLHAPKARGGSAILRNQALCPFRAFAVSRLGAEGLESPVDGISPLLHGSLLHRLLERFWAVTVNQENLLALDEESIRERLETLVSEVVQEDRGLNQRPQFRDVEARRLLRLALRHLALERTRDPFEVIGFEQEVIESFGDQNIRLIIDRIDRLASGGEAIIDYKTGRVDPKKWFGERPEDPQLPLYAISAAETPAAVVFAVLRDDECSYKGVVTETGQFPDLPPRPSKSNEALRRAGESMPATVKQWREVLHGLMADFLAGRAAVDPKDGRQTCDDSYCDLQPLCRIAELDQWRREGSE